MTTPKDKEFDTAEVNLAAVLAKIDKRKSFRLPAPAKAQNEAKPAEPAAPASPPKPPAAAPSVGLDQPAAEVCSRFPLGDASLPLLLDGQTARAFLQSLVTAKLFVDAIKVLAHAAAKREAVWWACQCCRHGATAEQPPKLLAAVEAAELWAADPTEENRRAAYPAAEASGFDTPAGCAAVAAFWSGGSMGPPNVPVIPPGEWLTAHGVAGAIQLAAAAVSPGELTPTYQKFIVRGVVVADGTERWKEPPAAVAESKPAPAAGRAR